MYLFITFRLMLRTLMDFIGVVVVYFPASVRSFSLKLSVFIGMDTFRIHVVKAMLYTSMVDLIA